MNSIRWQFAAEGQIADARSVPIPHSGGTCDPKTGEKKTARQLASEQSMPGDVDGNRLLDILERIAKALELKFQDDIDKFINDMRTHFAVIEQGYRSALNTPGYS